MELPSDCADFSLYIRREYTRYIVVINIFRHNILRLGYERRPLNVNGSNRFWHPARTRNVNSCIELSQILDPKLMPSSPPGPDLPDPLPPDQPGAPGRPPFPPAPQPVPPGPVPEPPQPPDPLPAPAMGT
jgi:hypothetical protein